MPQARGTQERRDRPGVVTSPCRCRSAAKSPTASPGTRDSPPGAALYLSITEAGMNARSQELPIPRSAPG